MYLYDRKIVKMRWLANPIDGSYSVMLNLVDGIKVINIPGNKMLEYSIYSTSEFESDQMIIEYLFNYCGLKLEKVYLQ
jgi:hypothetical protein